MAIPKSVRYKGELVDMSKLCKRHAISTQLLQYRMKANPKISVENLLYPAIDNNSYFTIKGKKLTTIEICTKYKLSRSTFQARINRYFTGNNIEELLYPTNSSPSRKAAAIEKVYEYKGETKTLREWVDHSPRKLQSFLNAVKKQGLVYAIEQPLQHKTSTTKSRIYVQQPVPDTSSHEWDDDLELSRLVAADLEAGYTNEEIIQRRKRTLLNARPI